MTISTKMIQTSLNVGPSKAKFTKLVLSKSLTEIWVGQIGVEKNQDTSVCQLKAERGGWTKGNTIKLPYTTMYPKGPEKAAPYVSGLCIDKVGNIWVCDSTYGTLYRVKADKSTVEIINQASLMSERQFWAMTMVNASGREYVSVLDTNANVYLFEPLTAAINANPDIIVPLVDSSVGTSNTYTFTFHSHTAVLWTLLQPKSGGDLALSALPMSTSGLPSKDDAKVFSSTELNDVVYLKASPTHDYIYAGTSDGKVICLDVSAGVGAPPVTKWTTTLPQHHGVTPSLDFLEVDQAGYVWTGDHNNNDKPGCIYGLEFSQGKLIAQYQLHNNGSTPVSPAVMAWMSDALLVADDNPNNQVLRIDVSDTGPVDPAGKATYTLKFAPEAGTTNKNENFGPNLKLMATATSGSSINAVVALEVDDEAKAKLTATQSPIQVTTSGLVIDDFKALGEDGDKVSLTATGRGNAKAAFNGTIQVPVSGLDFIPSEVRYTPQKTDFGTTDKMPKLDVTPNTSTQKIPVTLLGNTGSVFKGTPDKTHVELVNKNTLPIITAGNKAGPLIIHAQKGSHKRDLTWYVLPDPSLIEGEFRESYHARELKTEAVKVKLLLKGNETFGDSSKKIGVRHWYVRVAVNDNLKFAAGAAPVMDDQGKWVVLQTDNDGYFTVPFDKAESIKVGKIKLTVAANKEYDGSDGTKDSDWNKANKEFILTLAGGFLA